MYRRGTHTVTASLTRSVPTPSNVLYVTASPRGEGSYSIAIADAFLERYALERPSARVDRLDAFAELPAFGTPHAQAKMAVIASEPVPDDAAHAWAQVVRVCARIQAADTLLFAVPMWNGGIPWALKLFVDIVSQPGIAFAFDPQRGYQGLLSGRRAVTVYTSRVFAPGVSPAFGVDYHSAYLNWWLRYVGIDEIHELRLQTTFPTPDLEHRYEAVVAQARSLASRLARGAVGAPP
jgi:FMN-dependent NADH-azoreductase